jgi:hypothetical protein
VYLKSAHSEARKIMAIKPIQNSRISGRSFSKKSFALITLALMATLAITTNAFRDSNPPITSATSATLTGTAPQANEKRDHTVEAELLTIRRTGFHPSSISRPEGKFLMALSNRSGAVELHLRLHSVGGASIVEAQVNRKKLDWSKIVTLPAGEYVLTEANHPDWICRITITNR